LWAQPRPGWNQRILLHYKTCLFNLWPSLPCWKMVPELTCLVTLTVAQWCHILLTHLRERLVQSSIFNSTVGETRTRDLTITMYAVYSVAFGGLSWSKCYSQHRRKDEPNASHSTESRETPNVSLTVKDMEGTNLRAFVLMYNCQSCRMSWLASQAYDPSWILPPIVKGPVRG